MNQGHGLTTGEARIMALSDAGWKAADIARELNLTKRFVQMVISEFGFGALAHKASKIEAAHRAADRAYVAALTASGGSFA